jgi:hypothetical protein
MHRTILISATLALGACPGEGSMTTSSASDTADSTGAPDASTGATSEATGTSGTTTNATTEASTTQTTQSTDPTTGEPVGYCHGFDVDASEKFLDMHVFGGELLVDGTTWPLECGGQGSWMFGLYPGFGGWDPGVDYVNFTIVVDVEGFNDNPDGHFFSQEVGYYIGCEDVIGGVLGVAPVIPPDTLPDLSVLDGKPATVTVTIPADGETLMVTANVTLQAPAELVMMGCMFG